MLANERYNPEGTLPLAEQVTRANTCLPVSQTGALGNIFLAAPQPLDVSAYRQLGSLVFNIRVIENPANNTLLVKLDSGGPTVSDTETSLPVPGKWHTVPLDIHTLLANAYSFTPGNFASIEAINNPAVFEPTGPMLIELDNICYEFTNSDRDTIHVFENADAAPSLTGKYAANGDVLIEEVVSVVSVGSAHNV